MLGAELDLRLEQHATRRHTPDEERRQVHDADLVSGAPSTGVGDVSSRPGEGENQAQVRVMGMM